MRGAIVAAGLAALVIGFSAQDLLAEQDPSGRKLEISFDLEGRVTLVAQNVTIREVLAEWGRVGGSYVVNAERLTGGSVTLRFENRPEREVIDSLLRTAAGYILGPRTARTAGPSLYETVMILPTSSPMASSAYPTSAGPAVPLRTPGAPEDEIPPVVPAVGVAAPDQAPAPPVAKPAVNTSPGVFVPIVPVTPVAGGAGRGSGS